MLAVAAVVGLIANRARQPLIVAFIAVGVIVGASVLGWVEENEPLELFAQMGIAVLLFLVDLRLDLHLVRTTGRVAVITGLGQVIFTSVIGYALALLLGMEPVTALYVAIALTFSSTIIIVKLLSDKREVDELHGRIAGGGRPARVTTRHPPVSSAVRIDRIRPPATSATGNHKLRRPSRRSDWCTIAACSSARLLAAPA